jgi:hypothetical protein
MVISLSKNVVQKIHWLKIIFYCIKQHLKKKNTICCMQSAELTFPTVAILLV